MVRDIYDRLNEMMLATNHIIVDVQPIALTMSQINHFKPPKNPTKLTDSRASSYIKKYGYSSWEVDALEPKILHTLLSSKIEENIDMSIFQDQLEREQCDIDDLAELMSGYTGA